MTSHESTPTSPRWLNEQEASTWLDLWSLLVWLPARLDSQLRQDSQVSLSDYQALSQISMAPQRTLRLSDLGAMANMSLSHLSRVISRLEKAGWVERIPDPQDGRSTLAVLTDAGGQKVEQSAPQHVETVRQLVFDRLGPEASESLGDALAQIVQALDPARKVRD